MGGIALKARQDGQIIESDWFDSIRTAIITDIVPRNAAGGAEARAATLGEESLRWLKAQIAACYWKPGDIKKHHSFNGAVGPGQGWMLCNGREINETNYDAEHGAGSWAKYVGTSPIQGLTLPAADDRYAIGSAQAPAEPTYAGGDLSGGKTVSIKHTHGWYSPAAPYGFDKMYDSNGNLTDIPWAKETGPTIGVYGPPVECRTRYNTIANPTFQPESIQVQFYMRII